MFPPGSVAGLIVIAGQPVMAKFKALETPPPGVGVKTVTLAAPGCAMSAAATAILNCVELTKVVWRSWPFQRTTDPLIKFAPFTVRLKPGALAAAVAGSRLASVGIGLLAASQESEYWPRMNRLA